MEREVVDGEVALKRGFVDVDIDVDVDSLRAKVKDRRQPSKLAGDRGCRSTI